MEIIMDYIANFIVETMEYLRYVFFTLKENPISIVIIVFVFGMYPLGTTGLWVRKGVELKRQLDNVRTISETSGLSVNKEWFRWRRKANCYIWCPITGWLIGYILIFLYTTHTQFFFSLLGLMIPVFGYHGKRFWLEPED